MKKYLVLGFAVWAVYANTFFNAFQFDDFPAILRRPWIKGIEQIPTFIFSWKERPFHLLTLNLNYEWTRFNVWSYHVVNIAAHMAVIWTLFYFLTQTINRMDSGLKYRSLPFTAALVMAVHPLNVEAVTYISSRSAVFATLFYLLTLLFFFQKRYFWAGISCFLGFMTKPILVSLPIMGLLYRYFFISKENFRLLFWITVLVMIVAMVSKIVISGFNVGPVAQRYTPSEYLLNQLNVIPMEYFRKMIFPINLNVDPFFVDRQGWTWLGSYLGPALIFLWVTIAFFIHKITGNPFIVFGMLWAFITLLPTSSIFPLLDLVAEHRTYIAMPGFCMALAGFLTEIGGTR